jgi:hypothetical protein
MHPRYAMKAEDLLNLLGQPAIDNRVLAALARFDISSRPALEEDEEDWVDWLLSRHGIEFGFLDEAVLLARRPSLRGKSPLVLAQLYFYIQHPGVPPYQGDLPFGLSKTDTSADVRRKLDKFEAARRSYIRDVWDLPSYRMIVTYVPGGAGIASVLCLLPLLPWPRGREDFSLLPRLDQVTGLFGQSWHSTDFRRVFAPLGIESFAADILQDGEADLRFGYGFELVFSGAGTAIGFAEDARVFSAIKLYRDRYLDAFGWKGELPYDIRFDDPQGELFRKVGRAPDQIEDDDFEVEDDDFEGFALWHFPRFSLHLLYSNLENLLISVTIMKPGYWESSDES